MNDTSDWTNCIVLYSIPYYVLSLVAPAYLFLLGYPGGVSDCGKQGKQYAAGSFPTA